MFLLYAKILAGNVSYILFNSLPFISSLNVWRRKRSYGFSLPFNLHTISRSQGLGRYHAASQSCVIASSILYSVSRLSQSFFIKGMLSKPLFQR